MPSLILILLEVGALLKMTKKAFQAILQCGQLPAFEVCGQWHFKRSNLDKWLEEQKVALKGKASNGEAHD
jgi:hypothetical protein